MRHHHLLNKKSESLSIGDVSTVVLISFSIGCQFLQSCPHFRFCSVVVGGAWFCWRFALVSRKFPHYWSLLPFQYFVQRRIQKYQRSTGPQHMRGCYTSHRWRRILAGLYLPVRIRKELQQPAGLTRPETWLDQVD